MTKIDKQTYKQLDADIKLDMKLRELQQNSEYFRRIKEAEGDRDKMMDVFEEFTGIKMTWQEFQQFALRRSELK